MTVQRQLVLAHVGTVLAMIIFGGATAATRVAGRSMPPFSLAVLRFGLAGGTLLLALALLARQRLVVARRDWPLFLLLGLSFAAFGFCFNIGLRLTEASRGGLMLATAPFWSALIARIAGWERLTPRQLLGLCVTLAGIIVAIAERGLHWQTSGRGLLGDLLLLIGVVVGSGNLICTKLAYRTYTPLTVSTYTMLVAAALLFLAALPEGLPTVVGGLTRAQLALVLYLSLPAGALGYSIIFVSLRYLTPTQSMVYVNLNPLTATAIGAALLGERLTPPFLLGFAIVLAGVGLVNWPVRKVQAQQPAVVVLAAGAE
jgi:drug/metabolite transporter (DMT)-like permease